MAGSRYVIVPATSFVKIRARSSLHAIDGKGTGLSGYFEGKFFGDRLVPEVRAHMHLEIPVSRLDSGNAVQDREMHRLMSSKAFPNIVAELTSAAFHPETNDYSVSGSVNVRGTSRLLTGRLEIRQRDGRVEITGERSIDVRQFGVTPPKILNFQVYPDVAIAMHLIAQLAE